MLPTRQMVLMMMNMMVMMFYARLLPSDKADGRFLWTTWNVLLPNWLKINRKVWNVREICVNAQYSTWFQTALCKADSNTNTNCFYLIARQTALCQADSSRRSSCLWSDYFLRTLLHLLHNNYYIIFYELRLFVIMVLPGFDTEIMGLLPEGLKMEGIKNTYQYL